MSKKLSKLKILIPIIIAAVFLSGCVSMITDTDESISMNELHKGDTEMMKTIDTHELFQEVIR